ncbi:hypothetical protein [Nonomuraea sp. NPDC052265]|uniref:hypothetical protein n=1 Tax=Nonomuraea sp. NPDC052265 TaxID=3364374 RepID=UPI0037C7F9F2
MIAKVSQREGEVLAAVAARLSNAQIANKLRAEGVAQDRLADRNGVKRQAGAGLGGRE